MIDDELLAFVRQHKIAVEASRPAAGAPQSACVGFAVSDAFELVFDTLETSRKAKNLRTDARMSLVVGWDLDVGRTIQIEGVADEPRGDDLARLKQVYFSVFPDGVERERWPGITYVRVRPTWIRSSDFRGTEPTIVERVPSGTTWDAGRRVLETRVASDGGDLRAWQRDLAREAERIEHGGSFRLLVDQRATAADPHDALRAVMKERGILCSAYAMVRKDEESMLEDDLRLGTMLRRSFTSRSDAELWLDSALHVGVR